MEGPRRAPSCKRTHTEEARKHIEREVQGRGGEGSGPQEQTRKHTARMRHASVTAANECPPSGSHSRAGPRKPAAEDTHQEPPTKTACSDQIRHLQKGRVHHEWVVDCKPGSRCSHSCRRGDGRAEEGAFMQAHTHGGSAQAHRARGSRAGGGGEWSTGADEEAHSSHAPRKCYGC